MPRLSVILPVHYRPKWAPFAFSRLKNQTPVPGWDLEVIAVGNIDDPTMEIAREHGFHLEYTTRPECGAKLNVSR